MAPPAAAPTPDERYLARHGAAIRERIATALRYPLMARRQGWSGQVTVEFSITESGAIRAPRIKTSSGHKLLDREALRTVEDAAPYPAPPEIVTVAVPVSFELD